MQSLHLVSLGMAPTTGRASHRIPPRKGVEEEYLASQSDPEAYLSQEMLASTAGLLPCSPRLCTFPRAFMWSRNLSFSGI